MKINLLESNDSKGLQLLRGLNSQSVFSFSWGLPLQLQRCCCAFERAASDSAYGGVLTWCRLRKGKHTLCK